jgi:hypothetical protein
LGVAEHLAKSVVHKQPFPIEVDLSDANSCLRKDRLKQILAVTRSRLDALMPGTFCEHTQSLARARKKKWLFNVMIWLLTYLVWRLLG